MADKNRMKGKVAPGMKTKEAIGPEEVRKALAILGKYKDGKKTLNERVIENEQWWKLMEWEIINKGKNISGKKKDPEPVSAWMFNSIINKHADFMDNFPAPNILAREESDKEAAKILSSVVPCLLEQNDYEGVYSDDCWKKLKYGTGVYGIFWNSFKHGVGDIEIRQCDILNMFWEPGVSDIQKSPNLFYQTLVDNDVLLASYPQLLGKTGDGILTDMARYVYEDNAYTENKSVVLDWYYKKTTESVDEAGIKTRKTRVHYCKICSGEVLVSTENSPELEMGKGIYEHGLYPFVMDVLFPIEGSPAGLGYIDIMKDCQMYIDKMGQSILKNTVAGAKPRYLCKDGSGINEEEFADLSKDLVHYTGDINGIKPIDSYRLDSVYVQVLVNKIDELKETSGNRDFSQGSTTSGVTAASAIAALQEAGSKLSRDMIKTSYRAFRDVVYQVIELIRQFYTTTRVFRITGDKGQEQFVEFDNRMLQPEPMTENFGLYLGGRKPYFDIKISAQKASPFTRIAQNELAKELYNMGFFNPALADQVLMCLGMMDFDGKEEIERKVAENGTMYQKMMQMQQQMTEMSKIIAETTGDTRLYDAMASQAPQAAAITPRDTKGSHSGSVAGAYNGISNERVNSTAGKARERAASASTPKV